MDLLAETSLQTTTDMVPPVPWPDPAAVKVEGLRIGMYTDNGYFPAAPALRRAVREAADALRSRGATVEPITPPDVVEGLRIFLGVITANGLQMYKQLLGDDKPVPQIAGLLQAAWTPSLIVAIVQRLYAARGQRHLVRAMEKIGPHSLSDYWDLVKARNRYRARFYETLDEGNFDAILCPPVAVPAFTHGASEHLLPAVDYGMIYNVLGTPAGVVSITRVRPGEESDRQVSKDMAEITARDVEQGSAGLPIGVQVVARHWREDIALRVMEALEDHFRTEPDYPTRPD
jgi:fatty acid amide hydrolase